jgi:hypothetical protein
MREACCVAVRLRPLVQGETIAEDPLVLTERQVRFQRQGIEKLYTVDQAFVPDGTQVNIIAIFLAVIGCISVACHPHLCRKMSSIAQLPPSFPQFSKASIPQYSLTGRQAVGKRSPCRGCLRHQAKHTPRGRLNFVLSAKDISCIHLAS